MALRLFSGINSCITSMRKFVRCSAMKMSLMERVGALP